MSLYPQHASLPLSELPSVEREEPEKLFYGGPDDESFSATSPEEYLQELYDDERSEVVEELVRQRGDVEIVAYRRRKVEPERFRWWASDAWELFVERFEEEFGGDDTCYRPRADEKKADAEARDLLAPIFERLARRYLRVWQCEEVSRSTWTVDQVLKVVRPPRAPAHHVVPVVVPVHRFEKRGGP